MGGAQLPRKRKSVDQRTKHRQICFQSKFITRQRAKTRKFDDTYLDFGFTCTTVGNEEGDEERWGGRRNIFMYQKGAQQRKFGKH